jgi:hypothetical protein
MRLRLSIHRWAWESATHFAAERNKYARDGLWKIGGSRQGCLSQKELGQNALLPFVG